MNVLEIVTLNKHGDFEEVLFSSILSYMLNPAHDHGLKHHFLQKVVREVYPEISGSEMLQAKVTSEQPLGKSGKVDIFITIANKVIAVEVKIWDRSAKNISKNNERQLERYCRYLSGEFKDRWKFVFLIPTTASRTCLAEFGGICMAEFKDNAKLMTWNQSDPISADYQIPESCIIQKSVMDIISEILEEEKRVDLPLNTLWLLDSLYDIIPDLAEEIPEPGRFPNKSALEKLDTWHIFEAFFTTGGRWPISLHTVVGIPYGWGKQRSKLHGNSLYRIRTVTDYYSSISEREDRLPREKVELELWPDVYDVSRERILDWLKNIGLGESALRSDYHLDANKNEVVKLITLDRNSRVTKEDVEQLHSILSEGFHKLTQNESAP